MNRNYDQVVAAFNAKLSEIHTGIQIPLKKADEGVLLCNNALYHFKTLVDQLGFSTIEEEIHFFKHVKVEPLSFLVYFTEIRSCHLHMPKLGVKNKLAFLKKRSGHINKFFCKNCDFIYYMEQDLNYLDRQYFIRSHQVFPLHTLPESTYLDPTFFTSHDMLWARIKGMNHFASYIQNLRQDIILQDKSSHSPMARKKPLRWTASKIALIELIYALHESQAINHGQDDLKTIALNFEQLFGVPLGNVYKKYSEIKCRKGIRARFMEEITHRLNTRMDRDDEY
ncbi:RteC domain-containing protein [Formosa sp. 3Alg 14/1]|uniref:RteC domain-containing protein n=1 Tax=Formosa sp. 3Alg 14/1 TaxID=3382190 RepID=UPI0039BDD5B3